MKHDVAFRARPISLLAILWIAIGMAGCAIASRASLSGSVVVTLTPASTSVLLSQSQRFDAVVQNDSQNLGVTWTLTQSGAACSPACGMLSTGANRATYSAPATLPQLAIVTVTAISIANSAKSASARITVIAQSSPTVSISLSPILASVPVGQSQQFDAVVQNDVQNKGVTWSLLQSSAPCSPVCGSLVAGGSQATYSAPVAVPQLSIVTLTATSVSDNTKSASALITVVAIPSATISVSVTPTSALVPLSQSQQFDALVQNDAQDKGVTWALTQYGVPCSPSCGSIVGFTTKTAIYAAPATVPNASVAVVTATSLADGAQSASASITVASSVPFGGTNQWVDITKYGARSVVTAPTAMAACTSESNVVTLSDNGWPTDFSQFEDGDSIRLDNCGPPTAMTPPTGVAVSPGMNAGGTPAVSGLSLGNSAYSYQVIACDKSGGCSAVSDVATTTSGAATLGRVTAPILRMSLSNNLMTVTTAKPHGFSKYALTYIQYFSTHTPSFEGWYIVADAPSPTTFTFLTSIDSRVGGTPTSDTSGGTAVGFNCNVVSWANVENAWKYFVYGRGADAMNLIGVAEPGTTAWQDYGATMMGNFSFPSFVPAVAPSKPTNQYLLTTISTGGGMASVTLADKAGNTVANVWAHMGSDAAIMAAFKAALYGTVFIPEGTYHAAAYLDLHALGPIYVAQAGTLQILDTVQIPGGIYWKGSGPNAPTQFQESPTPFISGLPGSYPTVYLGSGSNGQMQFDHITFNNYWANGILLLYADSGVSFNFDYVTFAAGGGGHLGYMNRQFIFRTGGFDYNFSNCTFGADQEPKGDITDIGYSFLPSALFAPKGPIGSGSGAFRHSWFVGKSAVESNASNSVNGAPYQIFEDTRTQSDLLPIYIVSSFPTANTQNYRVYFDGFSPADYPSAMTGNWAAINPLQVGLQNLSNVPTGNRPLLVGNPTVFLAQNGGTASSGPNGGGWFATGGSGVGYLLPPPAAPPLLTNSSGGAVPLGSHTYQVTWVDAFGNSTTVGPSATINIVSGMQTVLVTPPAAPAGALGWQYYRDGFLGAPSTAGCGPFELGTSESDVLPFGCGNSAPAQNTALSSGQTASGEETTAIELTGGGHKTVISGTFNADRTLTVPDVSGTIAVRIANGTVAMPVDVVAAGSCGTLVKATATGVLPNDVVKFSSSAAPPLSPVVLRISTWPATNEVNFQYCNETALGITPPPTTLNWQVVR